MSQPSLIPFAFNDNLVRVITRAGEPWFVLADICRVLALTNPSKAAERLDDDEIAVVDVNSLTSAEGIRGNPNMNVISESGLYALVFTSRKDEARAFRKWVTSEVLPAIRRTGGYATPAQAAAAPSGEDMPIALGRLKLDMVREARCAFGPLAARELWNAIGLPTLYPDSHDIGQTARTEGTGVLALERILSAKHRDRAIRARLAAALDGDEGEAEALRAIGVQCRERDGGVAFASSTPFMAELFKGCTHPALALRLIPGARDLSARSFGGSRSRATLVPMALVLNLLHAEPDEADAA